MANVTLTIEGQTVGNLSVSYGISDADAVRVVQHAVARFGAEPQGAIEQLGAAALGNILAEVVAWEKSEAAKAAADAVLPIEVA